MTRGDSKQPSLLRFTEDQTLLMVSTVLGIALLAGLFAGWVVIHIEIEVLNLHASIWGFLLVWAATVGYGAYKRVPSAVIGMGLYVMAGLIVLKPVALFIPQFKSQQEVGDQTAAIQSLADFFIWMIVFAVIAGVLFAVGNYFRGRAESTVLRITRRGFRTDE